MTDILLEPCNAEKFKLAIHLGLFGMGLCCLAYNAMAWSQRREHHLLLNMGVYACLASYEVDQIYCHAKSI